MKVPVSLHPCQHLFYYVSLLFKLFKCVVYPIVVLICIFLKAGIEFSCADWLFIFGETYSDLLPSFLVGKAFSYILAVSGYRI